MSGAGRREALRLGQDLRRGGRLAEAASHFRALAAQEPEAGLWRGELGLTWLALGRWDEAEAEFRAALTLDPADVAALRGLGRVALQWADTETASALFQQALKQKPDDPSAQVGLADSLRAAYRLEEAEAHYRAVLADTPDHAGAWGGLGQVRRARRDFPAARAAFERAAGADPENAETQAALGNALCDDGRMAEAAEAFSRALQLQPANLTALLGRVRLHWLLGEAEAAERALQAARGAHPDHPRVEVARKKLANGVARFDWRADVVHALGVLEGASATPFARLEACARLLEYGLTGPLEAALAPLAAKSPRARRMQPAARALQRSELDWRAGQGALDLRGFVDLPAPGAETAVIVFAGREERLFVGLELLHRTLRTMGVSLLYLRDLERTRYFGGVVGLSYDFASTVQALRQRLAAQGARRLLMIGTCMGVAAALRYGLELKAEAALGISARLTPWDPPLTPDAAAKLAALRQVDPQFFDDIPALYAQAPAPPRTTLIYADDYEFDAADARALGQAQNVTLAGVRGYAEHNGLMYLLYHGLLAPVLTEFVSKGELSADLLQRVRSSYDPTRMPKDLKAVGGSLQPAMWF